MVPLSLAIGLAAAAMIGVNNLSAPAAEHTLVYARDGSGAFGYKDTPVQPWSGFHVHDPDRPLPKRVDPGPPPGPGTPPSDAIVLFGGKDLDAWHPAEWTIENGELVAGRGDLVTKEQFGDCQAHVEWMAPDPPQGGIWDRGNNGVKLLGLFEVQIFDSYDSKIYADGQAAAIYAQTPPAVNACRKPGEWQSFDILLRAPRFDGDRLVEPARLTMLHNGVLVHFHQEIYGSSPHGGLAAYTAPVTKGPITLLAHNNPVRFRNFWIRPLTAAAGR